MRTDLANFFVWVLLLGVVSGCRDKSSEKISRLPSSSLPSPSPSPSLPAPTVATFSIVAVDRDTGEIGVAVQSRIVAVGAVVPYAEAGVGAVATQAAANPRYGPLGLALMHKLTPDEILTLLAGHDEAADHRQVGMVSADGQAAARTGASCMDWAGHRVGDGYTVQGNILAG